MNNNKEEDNREFGSADDLKDWLVNAKGIGENKAEKAAEKLFNEGFDTADSLHGISFETLREVGLTIPVAMDLSNKLEKKQQQELVLNLLTKVDERLEKVEQKQQELNQKVEAKLLDDGQEPTSGFGQLTTKSGFASPAPAPSGLFGSFGNGGGGGFVTPATTPAFASGTGGFEGFGSAFNNEYRSKKTKIRVRPAMQQWQRQRQRQWAEDGGATASPFGGAAPAPSGGLFGSAPASSGGLFGSPAAPAFGSPTTAQAFGGSAFGSTTFGSIAFASAPPAPSTGLFGAPAPTPAFGSSPVASTPAPAPFGAQPTAWSSVFQGSSTPAPGGLFGTSPPGQSLGGGTKQIPFQPTNRQDGTATVTMQSISAMVPYENKNCDELRYEDYLQGNNGAAAKGTVRNSPTRRLIRGKKPNTVPTN